MPTLQDLGDNINRFEQRLLEEVNELAAECNSSDPDSIRMRTREEIVNSPEFYAMALQMVAKDQLWDNQINCYGEKLPLYKPDTIRKKAKLGHDATKLVNYTNYWTGGFTNRGIAIYADREMNVINFEVRPPYDAFIPSDRGALTEENYLRFQAAVNEELDRRLKRWFREQLRTRRISL